MITKQQIEEILWTYLDYGPHVQYITEDIMKLIESDKPQQTEPQPEIWECVDDETPDWGRESNWRKHAGIKKGDKLKLSGISDDETTIWFIDYPFAYDITKFKRVS